MFRGDSDRFRWHPRRCSIDTPRAKRGLGQRDVVTQLGRDSLGGSLPRNAQAVASTLGHGLRGIVPRLGLDHV